MTINEKCKVQGASFCSGILLKNGIDYNEEFSSVARLSSIQPLLAFAVEY